MPPQFVTAFNNFVSDHLTAKMSFQNAQQQAPAAPAASPSYRPVPSTYSPYISEAYRQNPSLPKGFLEAALNQESSVGTDTRNRNNDVGRYGYLVGFTNQTAKDPSVSKLGLNFDTPGSAIMSAAKYMSYINQIHDEKGNVKGYINDPVKLYQRYNGGVQTASVYQGFGQKVKYYSGQ